jgi:hypothetical protein
VTGRRILVWADPSAAGWRAVRWAAAEAERRRCPLHVVVGDVWSCSTVPLDAHRGNGSDNGSGLPPMNGSTGGPALDALQELSVDAEVVVVPAIPSGSAAAVVAVSSCPIVVGPADAPAPWAAAGPVVLAVDPWTAVDVVPRAFEEASRERAPLLAVRAWTEPGADLGRPRPGPIAAWDDAEKRARRELGRAISPWRLLHPDVEVGTLTVQDEAGPLLVALSHHARMLVLGRAGPPVGALLRAARCPVLVVPPAEPDRTTGLPGRARSRAFTAG